MEQQRQKGAACAAYVRVCACSLRPFIVPDLFPFGGRKFACAAGVQEMGGAGSVEW